MGQRGRDLTVSDASWPDRLQDAGQARAVHQVFGWQPANWGTILLLLCVWLRCVQNSFSPGESMLWWLMLCGAVALCGHEIRRRKNQATLLSQGENIGLYRAGRLRQSFSRADITVSVHLTRSLNTTKAMFGLLFSATIAAALVLISARLQDRLMAVAALLAFVSSAISCYCSRESNNTQLLVPSPSGGREWIVVRRDDGKRLLASS